MPIVGTAGHVDHGKSTLVQALTGIDPDRWDEEKERGLTIDLGFAWTELGGLDVGFVDVPGHERFIKNMLAGVGALDCALFVVAADSGWMPQSEEHASVLDLLGVDAGVIALTRIDLVDDDIRELATLEVLERVEGTSLEGWAIVPVSPVSGEGLDELRSAVIDVLEASPAPPHDGFRMWIDRAFRPAGAGLVVTGTVIEGSVSEGDRLLVMPQGATATVRGIQHHGDPTDIGRAGSRTAINLTGAPDDVERGTVLVADDSVAPTVRILAELRPARAFDGIPDRGGFHLHVGTASVPATIRRIRTTDAFVLDLESPTPMRMGDRVILRESGRRAVVGGGVVLDPIPVDRPNGSHVEALASAIEAGRSDRADALVGVHGILGADDLRRATGGATPDDALSTGPSWAARSEIAALGGRVTHLARGYHADHPLRPGLPKGEAASQVGVPLDVIDVVVAHVEDLEDRSGSIALAGFSTSIDAAREADWQQAKAVLEQSFDVPRASSLGIDDELLHFLLRRGDLIRIGDDLVFTRRQVDEITERVVELPDGFTVADFRDHFGMARRQAVPTLEWLDGTGRTRRSGDGRTVR